MSVLTGNDGRSSSSKKCDICRKWDESEGEFGETKARLVKFQSYSMQCAVALQIDREFLITTRKRVTTTKSEKWQLGTQKKSTPVESVVCLTKAKLQKKTVFCIVLLMSRRRSSASQNSIENATSLIFFHHSVKQEKLAYNQHQIMLHWEGIMSFHQRPLRKSAQTFPRIAEKWAAASSHHSTRQFILLSVYSTHQCADMNEWKLKMHR